MKPELKILAYVAMVIGVFFNQSLTLAFAISLIIFGLALKLASKSLRKSSRIVIVVLSFTFLSNLLFQPGRVLCTFCALYVTQEGLTHAVLMTLRLFAMIYGAQLLNSTTSSDELLKAMERLLGPIGKLKPVREFSAAICLTLKYLPLIFDQARECYKNLPVEKKQGFIAKVELRVSVFIILLERTLQSCPSSDDDK